MEIIYEDERFKVGYSDEGDLTLWVIKTDEFGNSYWLISTHITGESDEGQVLLAIIKELTRLH